MAKRLKGKKVLNKAITAQLSGFGISEAILGKEYSYFFENESVSFKITENSVEDAWFIEFIKERFNYDVEFPFVLSLLHEVGHHKTYDDLGEMIEEFCDTEKERINAQMVDANADTTKKLEWQYFNLPDEIMATQWAVNYAIAHPRKIKKMWKEMHKALDDFYRVNGLYDDTDEE